MASRKAVSDAGTQANGRVRLGTTNPSKGMITPRTNAIPQPVQIDDGQPIAWLTTREVLNGPWRGNNRHGKERLPSIAHTADDSFDVRKRTVHPRAHSRYRRILNAAGNVVSVVHSNGASHLPVIEHGGRFSRDQYAQFVINKGVQLGWIDVDNGCLKRQLADGLVNPTRVLTYADLKGSKQCAPGKPCVHTDAELKARQARHSAREREADDRLKSSEQRLMEEMKSRDGSIVDALTKVVAKPAEKP